MFNSAAIFGERLFLAVVPVQSSYRTMLVIGTILLLLLVALALALLYPALAKQMAFWVWDRKLAAFVVVVGACVLGGILRTARPPFTTAPDSFRVDGDWPLDRGGLCRLGVAPHGSNVTLSGVQWTYDRRDEAFYSSPAVVGDYVFAVGSRDDRGRIYCFDQRSGDVVWSCSPPDYLATFSSPVIAGQRLFCGEGLHRARQARVVCVDLRPGQAGRIVWTFRTNGHVECTPVITDGRVYFGAGDDGIYCLDAADVVHGSPRVVFHLPGTKYPDVETALVVHDGKLFAGLGIGGEAICVFDAHTGAEIKRLALPYPVFGPPSIDRGKLYAGLGAGNFVTPHKTRTGQVCCLNLTTLAIDWSFEVPGTVLGAVAAANDRLFFGASDGFVYCLTTGGELVAKIDCGAPVACSVAVTDDSIFVVNDAGKLLCLDRTTLAIRGEMRLGTSGRFISSPVVAGNRIFVGTESHGFICAGASTLKSPAARE